MNDTVAFKRALDLTWEELDELFFSWDLYISKSNQAIYLGKIYLGNEPKGFLYLSVKTMLVRMLDPDFKLADASLHPKSYKEFLKLIMDLTKKHIAKLVPDTLTPTPSLN